MYVLHHLFRGNVIIVSLDIYDEGYKALNPPRCLFDWSIYFVLSSHSEIINYWLFGYSSHKEFVNSQGYYLDECQFAMHLSQCSLSLVQFTHVLFDNQPNVPIFWFFQLSLVQVTWRSTHRSDIPDCILTINFKSSASNCCWLRVSGFMFEIID